MLEPVVNIFDFVKYKKQIKWGHPHDRFLSPGYLSGFHSQFQKTRWPNSVWIFPHQSWIQSPATDTPFSSAAWRISVTLKLHKYEYSCVNAADICNMKLWINLKTTTRPAQTGLNCEVILCVRLLSIETVAVVVLGSGLYLKWLKIRFHYSAI